MSNGTIHCSIGWKPATLPFGPLITWVRKLSALASSFAVLRKTLST